MRKLTLTIGIAVLAVAFPGANASEETVSQRTARAAPYEETEFDRTLPDVSQRMERPRRPRAAPYEELGVERTLPSVSQRMDRPRQPRGVPYEEHEVEQHMLPVVPERGSMDGEASAGASVPGSVWDSDHNFVAPAQ